MSVCKDMITFDEQPPHRGGPTARPQGLHAADPAGLQAGIGRIRGGAGINQVAGGKMQRVCTTSKVNGWHNGQLYAGGFLRTLPLSFPHMNDKSS